uniref:Uncharacterized protein n=2 Tax=Rhodnius prolixus TaxID=13249 RepID=A0A4V0Y8R8_RHOPR
MALILSKNLSATLLVLTSFHSFNRLPPYFYYARAAFKLYMLCGCLLIFDGVRRSSFSVEAVQTVWLWNYCLGLPLISAEICVTAGHLSQFTNVHIILPIYTVLSYHFAPEYVDAYLLGLSHVFSLSCVTILSFTTDNVACIAFAIVYYFAQFRLSPYGNSDPSYMETWCFVMSVGNLFALQLLKRFRWRD